MVILLGYTGRAEAAGKVQLKTQQLASTRRFTPITAGVQKPAVSVRYRGKKLSVNKDYTLVLFKGRKNPGVYTVAVKGKGSYSGTVKKTFRINPVGTKLASMQSPSGGTTLKLTWKRPSRAVSGYQSVIRRGAILKGEASTISGATRLTTTLKPETGYPLLSADSELLPLCEKKICLFRLVPGRQRRRRRKQASNGNTNNGNTNNNGNADPLGFLNETYASLRKKREKPLKFMLPTKFRASIFQSQML